MVSNKLNESIGSGGLSQQQRELLSRQQASTPKIGKMGVKDGRKGSFIEQALAAEEHSNLSFWNDESSADIMPMMRAGGDTSMAINQSIVEQYGSAQDLTDTIQHDIYKSVNERVSATLDYSINGEGGNDANKELSATMGTADRAQMLYPRGTRVSQALVNSITSSFTGEPDMIPDDQAQDCFKCHSDFKLLFRRHHCKICRKVFCKNCSLQTMLDIDGVMEKIRTCKQCKELHTSYSETLRMQRPLLDDRISSELRQAESSHFSSILSHEKATTPMNIEKIGVQPAYYIRQASMAERQKRSLTMAPKHNTSNAIEPNENNTIAQLSATNKRAIQQYLQGSADAGGVDLNQSLASQQILADQVQSNRVLDKRTNEWLNYKLRAHLDAMIDEVIEEHKIDSLKWRKIMANCTKHAVMTIRPSSRLLADSIDFNSFIKIVNIHHHNQEKCQYINGVAFKKDVNSRRMRTQIENPKILLLNGSLGYVQEEDGAIDMQAEINQQDSLVRIIRSKINALKPDIIFVEKDASRLALQLLEDDKITVVTNTSAKILKMIARQTQTIVCPSTHLLDRRFIIGYCLNFRIDKIKTHELQMTQHRSTHALADTTSLMFLEGCQAKLGCSIVLSGPDTKELKIVRRAIKTCLRTARILLLEREFFRFIVPEIDCFKPTNIEEEQLDDASINKDDAPELIFREDTDQDSLMKPGNNENVNPAEFELFDSPYLFHKHMQRSEIVFERYNLVQPQDAGLPKNVPKLAEDKTVFWNMHKVENRNSAESDSSRDPQMTEGQIKKKLHTMCYRPRRLVKTFLNDEQDMSLFTFLKQRSAMPDQSCPQEGCGKPMLQHTDYWYHGNGAVSIVSQQDGDVVEQHATETAAILDCFCLKCKRVIIKRETMPSELLEISFFKLLEMIYYNEKVSVSSNRDQEYLGDHPACTHSLFHSGKFVFRYQGVKTTMNFEKLEPYSLDLYHFGLEKGTVSDEKKKELITDRLSKLRIDMLHSFHFMLSKIEVLFDFMDQGIDEVKSMSVIEPEKLDIHKNQILGLMNKFKHKLSNQLVHMMAEIFSESVEGNLSSVQTLIETVSMDETNTTYQEASHAAKINTLMQFNRLHKIVSARMCEFLFFIKHLYSLIRKDFINAVFPKKLFFKTAEAEVLANQAFSSTQSAVKQQADLFGTGIVDFSASQKSIIRTNSQTSNAQLYYKEMLAFEEQLRDATYIASIVAQNQFIPPGFNQNCTELIKFGEQGAKKSMDLAALIASALSSNLYLNGLAELEYLDLRANIQPFDGNFIEAGHESQVQDNEILRAASEKFDKVQQNSQKVQLQKDVMNEPMTLEIVEQELISNPATSFKISFSTHQQNANIEVLADNHVKKQIVHGYEDSFQFYSQVEQIASLDNIEVPLPQTMFDELAQLSFNISVLINEQKGSKRKSSIGKSSQVGRRQSITAEMVGSLLKTKHLLDLPNECPAKQGEVVNYSHETAYNEIYHFFHEKLDYCVKVYCPKQFEALRKLYCGPYNEFLHSVFRSEIWSDNSGGKSASTFFKSFDNKYVLKAVDGKEIKMFEDMSSSYFEYLSQSFTLQCPTAIAKVLGLYRITIKRRKQTEHFSVLLMENLNLNVDERVAIKYDLKGSRRNRFIHRKSANQVVLDNNFLFDRKSRPIPMQNAMKRMLKIAIANDSLYLTRHSIIDYSVFVIINPEKRTIRLGIIDYIQQYTFDKELESFMKQKISNTEPTIIPPEQYKKRFRAAIDKYFVALVPDDEEKVSTLMDKRFGANKIKWATKVSSESTLKAAIIHRMQTIISEQEERKKLEKEALARKASSGSIAVEIPGTAT